MKVYGAKHGSNPKHNYACKHNKAKAVTISGYHRLHSESQMRTWMLNHGPLAIGIYANSHWFHYRSGHLPAKACSGHKPNHAVQCVGYDDELKVWIVMNSWGRSWGVKPSRPYKHVS